MIYLQRMRIFKNDIFDLMVGLSSDVRIYFRIVEKRQVAMSKEA